MNTLKKIGLMILIGIIYFALDTMLAAGVFKSISNTFNGKVLATYRGIYGPEDLEWDRENNLLFISSLDRWRQNAGNPQTTDGIYMLHTDVPNAVPEQLPTDLKTGFHPHGISLFKQNGRTYMYAVNHNGDNHSVELFEFNGSALKHLATYADKLMVKPNDVAGDEVGKFYVTTDHGNTTPTWQKVEDFLRMPYSYVLYFDGTEFRKVHQGMVYANGVRISRDGTKLYATHTIGHELFVLDRNKKTGSLILKETIDLKSGVDNIDEDEQGNIWIAAHPKLFAFLGHAKDATKKSPSQLFCIRKSNDEYQIEKVYENDGSQISAASTIVVYRNTAFVGCVFDDKMLKLRLQ